MLDFCRLKIKGVTEASVKKLITAKVINYRFSRLEIYLQLASSGPYGPLLARSGYPGQDASFYNNQMVMICATVNAPTLL